MFLFQLTGARLLSYLRFQVSVLVEPIETYPVMSKLLKFNLPYNWYEFTFEAPKNVTKRIRMLHM